MIAKRSGLARKHLKPKINGQIAYIECLHATSISITDANQLWCAQIKVIIS